MYIVCRVQRYKKDKISFISLCIALMVALRLRSSLYACRGAGRLVDTTTTTGRMQW